MKKNTEPVPGFDGITGIPRLPSVVRYYDDFSDSYNELRDLETTDRWTIWYDGKSAALEFGCFDTSIKPLIKCWCAYSLGVLSPRTVHSYYLGVRKLDAKDIFVAVTTVPHQIRSFWKRLHGRQVSYYSFESLQNLLAFCCRHGIARWTEGFTDLISQLELPKRDKYASVRSGDVFITTAEESAIVRYFDQCSNLVTIEPDKCSDGMLEEASALLCSYSFGPRPKQIALLKMRDIRVRNNSSESSPSAHLTFTMIKQRSEKRKYPMVRRVKKDWCPIIAEFHRRCHLRGLSGTDHIFQRTPYEVAKLIADLTERISGIRRTATELRHSAAQRLVDAGVSEEELAEFMGHTDLNTGLIYFRSSFSQAERVNRALGVSEVYRQVARIAHNRFISTDELMHLKGDQQIAGVPHGIPISGIGGCSSGQPNCPYNPVMSCYGCPKFMPVTTPDIHRRVLEDLREIFKMIYAASRAERGSPAFQLEKTIAEVQGVLAELEAPDELPS